MMDPLRIRLARFLAPKDVKRIEQQSNREVAWAIHSILRGLNNVKYNPDDLIGRKGYGIYQRMMLDEQVKAVVKFKRDAITSRDHYFEFTSDVELSDKEKENRIGVYTKMIDEWTGSFNDGLNFIMKAMHQGFSMTEISTDVFKYKDKPYIGVRRLTPKPYDTFEFVVDDYGTITKTIQKMEGKEQKIDLKKFIYFVHNPEIDYHYGSSDLREAYRSYLSKDIILKFHNVFLERLAGGFVHARPKEGTTLKVGSADYNAIRNILDNITSGSGILTPSNVEMDVISVANTDAFEKAITLHDLQIAKALLVPNLLGVTHQGDTGSYSQASTQLEAFLWTLDADANRLADAFNEQVFKPLHELNFADGIGPKFKFKPVSEEKKLEIIKTWKELVTSGAVEASDTDEGHLRELLDFPEKGEPIKKSQPIDPATGLPVQPGQEKNPPKPGEKKPDPDDDETILAEQRLTNRAAFTRATKRVAFAVIDRKSRILEDTYSQDIEERLVEMVNAAVEVIRDDKLGTPAGTLDAIGKFDFDTRSKTRARKAINTSLKEGWNLGLRHARDEVSTAHGDGVQVAMARIDEDAAEFINANGFRMLGNLTDAMKAIVKNVLMNGIKYSWTTDAIILNIFDLLTTSGFMSLKSNARSTSRLEDDVAEALQEAGLNAHRVRTAVRTNTFEAINEARYSVFTDPELDGFVEALEYSAILDDRTTDICRHLDGRVYPSSSDQWNSIRPPNHYNCRSVLVPVTVVDTDVTGKDNEKGSRWSKPTTREPQKGFG